MTAPDAAEAGGRKRPDCWINVYDPQIFGANSLGVRWRTRPEALRIPGHGWRPIYRFRVYLKKARATLATQVTEPAK